MVRGSGGLDATQMVLAAHGHNNSRSAIAFFAALLLTTARQHVLMGDCAYSLDEVNLIGVPRSIPRVIQQGVWGLTWNRS